MGGRLPSRHLPLAAACRGAAAFLVFLVALCRLPLAWNEVPKWGPPGPLALRTRTKKLRDPYTGLPRPPPEEADIALDYFQRTFPDVTTDEAKLVQRWEDLVAVFGGADAANELVLEDPSVLRMPRPVPRRAFHYLSLHLGPEVARKIAFTCPFILTKLGGQLRRTLPALLNIYGKKRLGQIALEYPMLMHLPVADFYQGMPNMIAICGNPEKALEVAKEAMDEIRKTPYKSDVPDAYPALVAIFGGFKEARAALDQEPLLLKWQGEQFLGKLLTLRQLLGSKEAAQEVLRKAPFFLHNENQRKSHKFKLAFAAMERLFGTEATRELVLERPELLALGDCLRRALNFAERKMGSREAVAKNFESVLKRTGLAKHLGWETKARPRHGYWTPKSGLQLGYPPNPCSWSPHRNPRGRAAPARGQWDEEVDNEPQGPVVDAEILSPAASQ